MPIVYLGLGTNLGDREAHLREAVRRLDEAGVHVTALSPLYETAPVGYLDQPDFLNAVCRAECQLPPHDLLRVVKGIEAALGRRPSFRNAPRPVDIDILFYDDRVLDTPDLVIPHPRLAERAFVLVPLTDLAPEFVHPVLGHIIADLLTAVDRASVHPYGPHFGIPQSAIATSQSAITLP